MGRFRAQNSFPLVLSICGSVLSFDLCFAGDSKAGPTFGSDENGAPWKEEEAGSVSLGTGCSAPSPLSLLTTISGNRSTLEGLSHQEGCVALIFLNHFPRRLLVRPEENPLLCW